MHSGATSGGGRSATAAAVLRVAGVRPGATVVAAMSGGVDSAVAAALLHRAGHRVIGVTLQLYDHGAATARKGSCCAGQDIHDARRVADVIGIPHYVLDYEQRFRTGVIDRFAQSYIDGETPVPCVACNSTVKFTQLMGFARELGAEALATGHYIQRRDGASGPTLHRAADSERDQSYFLFDTTPDQLATLAFPLGGLAKSEVRAIAGELGLPVALKADSQDICFVPEGRYADVIARLRPDAASPGDIVHVDGRVLGRHAGIMHFTVGQRKGLGIAVGEPLHVLRLDARQHRVIVGPREHLATRRLELRGVNWLGEAEAAPQAGSTCDLWVRLRSTQPPQPATLLGRPGGRHQVLLARTEHGIAAGQACVFYEHSSPQARVLGGGWIARTDAGARFPAEASATTASQPEIAPARIRTPDASGTSASLRE